MGLPRLAPVPPSVEYLFDYPGYQRNMLLRIERHEGFASHRVEGQLYDVLCLRGSVFREWLKSIGIYYRTPGQLYFSMVKSVDIQGSKLFLLCLPFVRTVYDENTPNVQVGINIASVNTNDVRCIPGSATTGRFNHPTLPP